MKQRKLTKSFRHIFLGISKMAHGRAQYLQKAARTTNFSTEKQVFKSSNVLNQKYEKSFNWQHAFMLRLTCGTLFFDPLSKDSERWCSSSLRSSSHYLSGPRAPLSLDIGSPRWCHRIERELRHLPEIESLLKIVIQHVSKLNSLNLIRILSKSWPFW
jgi:hypothetical protein